MSTVKISELSPITVINANTSNTLLMGVDIPTGVTGKFTAHTLAQGLYLNEVLNVGNNAVVFPNTIAQFSGNSITYLQINMQNFESSGSGDFIVTADTGTNSNSFVDLGINNSDYSDPDFSAMKAYDGYLYVHGQSDTSSVGNLVIGTASSDANLIVMVGGTTESNVIAVGTKNGLVLNRPIVFADGTSQNTSVGVSASLYANGAFVQANAAFIRANTPHNVSNSAALYANGAFVQANAAFSKANSSLANTTGTFGGDLSISGNLTTSGIINIQNSTFNPNTAFVSIVASDNFATASPSNTNYMLHVTGKANSVTRVVLDSFGQTTYPLLAGRMGRGSAASPAAVANNDVMMRIVGNGYTGTQFPSSSPTKIDFVAAENFSDTKRGTRIEFWNTEVGSNTISKIASFNANNVVFSGVVNPQKGFEYTPNNITTNSTTYTVDFSRDSMIRMSVNDNTTITLQNYVYGKLVEVWITNSAAQNKTITHGCLANNSTSKATTFTIQSSSCAFLRYFSIDGDQANTFVSIVA